MGLLTTRTENKSFPGLPGIKETLTKDLRDQVVYKVTGDDSRLRLLSEKMGWSRQEAMEMLFRETWDFETVCDACDALNIRVQLTFGV